MIARQAIELLYARAQRETRQQYPIARPRLKVDGCRMKLPTRKKEKTT